MFPEFFYHNGKSEKDQSQQKHPIGMKTKPFENKWSQGKDRKWGHTYQPRTEVHLHLLLRPNARPYISPLWDHKNKESQTERKSVTNLTRQNDTKGKWNSKRYFSQRRWQFRGFPCHQGNSLPHWPCWGDLSKNLIVTNHHLVKIFDCD